jgi:hemolysin D
MTVINLPNAMQPAPQADAKAPNPSPSLALLRSRLNDPLRLIHSEAPQQLSRIVLWIVCLLALLLFIWAAFGKLDIVATAEGKLVPQSLVKIVQPAEAGVVKQILVKEGDVVQAGQVLLRLDTTLARADKASIGSDLAMQRMQERRILAELGSALFIMKSGDDAALFAQVQAQLQARRKAQQDTLEQERFLLAKAQGEQRSANEQLAKLQQTLPTYQKSAQAYQQLEKEGFIGQIASAEKQREALEKTKDLDSQRESVKALDATIAAQNKRIAQIQSAQASELQKELSEVRAKIEQLRPSLDKSAYREGLMELRAPQAGTVKDLATTTEGAVVQPASVLLTLVPQGEALYADVMIKNEDIGFVQPGQSAQVKLAAFPFQKYGLLQGKVIHVSADASESNANPAQASNAQANQAIYKARLQLEQQHLIAPSTGQKLAAGAGMQVSAEIHQGRRTVLEYLLSPVTKAAQEAGRER